MKTDFIGQNPWSINVNEWNPEQHPIIESLLSIGNGRLGQRANFPERYSGPSLQGNYIAGVYYPDKTRVGWWKNGYPQYFAKVPNSVNWIGIDVHINGKQMDLADVECLQYSYALLMDRGSLLRNIRIRPQKGLILDISSERFYSINHLDIASQRYNVRIVEGSCNIALTPYLDFNIRNSDANYNEDFWHKKLQGQHDSQLYVQAQTRKTNYTVAAAMDVTVFKNDKSITANQKIIEDGYVALTASTLLAKNESLALHKYVSITSSLYHQSASCIPMACSQASQTRKEGYDQLSKQQEKGWKQRWSQNDVIIGGDAKAQQGIRFNIFQLYQTYSGEDPRLNIGPKGFTGEKYGGSTYWDTEAYCLPFYMCTTSQKVARNLLLYRYHHLDKAIANARLLGFSRGAALYPMVTMNGEECHNEWEITFEEIHRNGAIAYAIYNYIRYTDDIDYLYDYGIDVLVAIARFWTQRVNWSPSKQLYVILGVTGPNEYENNVNNNWYTNFIARWCLQYTLDALNQMQIHQPESYGNIVNRLQLDDAIDHQAWRHIIDHIYLPQDDNLGIFLQQDGYLDKEDKTVQDISEDDRPIHQNWSWDRILRSPYIKQADVLQGLYFFENDFDLEILRKNFAYYEPRTVHESSLSPCVHSILAARLGIKEKAYEMFLRTARLDLDNYNNDTEEGCHITSMAGSWMSIVEGLAGMSMRDDCLHFAPILPQKWTDYSFKILFRECPLHILITDREVSIHNHGAIDLMIQLYGRRQQLAPRSHMIHALQQSTPSN